MIWLRRLYSVFLWIVLLGLVVYSGSLWYARAHPCDQPITYKIGELDPQFGVSTSTFEADIAQAAGVWDTAADKDLFAYDPNGAVTINLVYDSRQETTVREATLRSDISSDQSVAASVKAQYLSLTNQYNAAQTDYENALQKFQTDQSSYNAQVEHWNSSGSIPPSTYSALTTERQTITAEQSSVESDRQQVNNLADQINALIDKYNLLVDHINATADTINNDGLAGTQFEEGVYMQDASGRTINIYQFDNQTFFVRVIAHELGHALGMEHNQNPDSIMNPVNTSSNMVPTEDDMAELRSVCDLK